MMTVKMILAMMGNRDYLRWRNNLQQEFLKNQIEERKRLKEQELEKQRKLEMQEEETFRQYTNQLEHQQKQQRQHLQQSLGQGPFSFHPPHHQSMHETGASLMSSPLGNLQRGPVSGWRFMNIHCDWCLFKLAQLDY